MVFIFLSQVFYDDYRHCAEIEQKADRPYIRACVEINGTLFAIPLRSHINHPHVLWTDKENRCGVDFSKTVVLVKPDYIDASRAPHIRPREFDALRGKEHIIRQRLMKYIRDYKKAKMRPDIPRNQMLCAYSTLQYFEDFI